MKNPRICLARSLWVVVLSCFVFGGCVMSESERKHTDLRRWCWEINDGRGSERPLFSKKDRFALLPEFLRDRDELVRSSAAIMLSLTSVMTGKKYMFVLDAYVDAGRSKELAEHLKRAWLNEKPGFTRFWMLESFLQLKMLEYLRQHPEAAHELDPDREVRPWLGRIRFGATSRDDSDYRFFAERIIPTGDEDFAKAWAELQEYYAKFRRDYKERFGHD